MPAPEMVVLPMTQHIGAPCKPMVKVGDIVDVGQQIAGSDAFVSAPIHASVSGKIKKIDKITMPDGGKVDAIIMRIMDGLLAFPSILLSILLVTALGSGVFNVILAIAIPNIPGFARVVRSKVIVVKNEEYCNAERILGASKARIMFSHILPNAMSEVIVYATLRVGTAIISEASLSFLGLGILIPTPSWGNILRGGRSVLTTAPHISLISGLFIFVAVIGFNLAGDGIRDVMDPKMKK